MQTLTASFSPSGMPPKAELTTWVRSLPRCKRGDAETLKLMRLGKMPKEKQKSNSFLKRIFPFMVGAFSFFIILGFIFKDVSEALIAFGLLAALSFVYAVGYFIVIIYEKFEKRRRV